MDSCQQDAAMVLLGWVLGIGTLPIAKDSDAKEKCLYRLYEIKRLCEDLSEHMHSPARSVNGYNKLLAEIRPNIEKLNIEKTGLVFPCYMLNDLIVESLVIFRAFDPHHENLAFDSTSTAVNLMMLWGGDFTHRPDFKKVEDIQNFICGSILTRCLKWYFINISKM